MQLSLYSVDATAIDVEQMEGAKVANINATGEATRTTTKWLGATQIIASSTRPRCVSPEAQGWTFFERMQVYKKVQRHNCQGATGREPIKVRWVGTNEQDEATPEYSRRLVAKDFKRGSDPDLYTATPPIDTLRLLISLAAPGYSSRGPGDAL